MILSQLWQAELRAPGSKNVSCRGCVAMWPPGAPRVQILFALFFTWRSLLCIGRGFQGAAAPCV